MSFDEYQNTAKQFAVYPNVSSGSIEEIMYLTLGLTGESGEVAEKIKKYYRDGEVDIDDIKKEIGDVLWYAANLAKAFGLSFDDVAQTNIDKLTSRLMRNKLHGSGDNR